MLFLTLFIPLQVQAKQIVLIIPDQDIKIVEADVIDAEQWINQAWQGKLANSKERLVKKEVERSVKSNETLPAGQDAILSKALARPDFKSRKDSEPTFNISK